MPSVTPHLFTVCLSLRITFLSQLSTYKLVNRQQDIKDINIKDVCRTTQLGLRVGGVDHPCLDPLLSSTYLDTCLPPHLLVLRRNILALGAANLFCPLAVGAPGGGGQVGLLVVGRGQQNYSQRLQGRRQEGEE